MDKTKFQIWAEDNNLTVTFSYKEAQLTVSRNGEFLCYVPADVRMEGDEKIKDYIMNQYV